MDFTNFANFIDINSVINKKENNLQTIKAKAKIYEIKSLGNIPFPEQDLNLIHERKFTPNGVSLAFNAGSTRAFTSGIGYVLGLFDIPIGDKNAFTAANYISSASGGSWFLGTYFYGKQANNLTEEEILGRPIPLKLINDLTLNTYNYDKKTFLPQTYYQSNSYLKLITAAIKGPPEKIWINFCAEKFLKPYNIENKVVSLNKFFADELKLNNPNIKDVIIPPPEFPYWICDGSLIYSPIVEEGLTVVPMTAMYAGFPQILGSGNEKVGGNLIETFAYGCKIPSIKEQLNPDILKNVEIPLNQGYFTLDDMIGISSASYIYETYLISQDTNSNLILKNADKLNPTYDLWSYENPNSTKQAQYGDGYLSGGGSGILPLLSRGVKKIICFLSPGSDIVVKPDSVEYYLTTTNVFGLAIAPLYGTCTNSPPFTSNPNSAQVFESKYYQDFINQATARFNSGDVVFVRQKLPVLTNLQNGILGNYEVDLLYIILRTNNNFNSQLPINISSQFTNIFSQFYQFPNYPEAIFRDQFIDYPKEKTNLLISYCYWTIQETELKSIIQNFYKENE